VESRRSVFFKNINDRIPYFEIHYSLFDIYYSLFQNFFFDLTGRFSGQRQRLYKNQDRLDRSQWLLGVASGHDYLGNRG